MTTDGIHVPESRTRERIANSFYELSNLALNQLRDLGKVSIVCGPITTGGRGSAEENVKAMKAVIKHLVERGFVVFDQFPFEGTLWTLKDEWVKNGGVGYCMPILEEFYKPLYASGFIIEAHFLPGWESSFGARWERDLLTDLKIQIVDFPGSSIDGLL